MQSIALAAAKGDRGLLEEAHRGIATYRSTGARIQVLFLLSLIAQVALELKMPAVADNSIAEGLSL